MDVDMYISEKNGSREMRIPLIPEQIYFKANETRFASYDILDRGEVRLPTGSNIHGYGWDGTLPGENSPTKHLIRGDWVDPKQYQSIWSWWRDNATALRLIVTGTPINHDVYLEDYDVKYKGAFGDYDYSISFIDAREFMIETVPKKEEPAPIPKRTETQSATTSYTVKSGDTLWGISQKFLGSGAKWKDIYNLNKDAIEADAKKHGKKSSSNGSLIFPGVSLKIKK